MNPELKEKLRVAREVSRARKTATDAELTEGVPAQTDDNPNVSELEALRAELAELKAKTREKAAHEHETIKGDQKIFDQSVGGAQENVRESLRELLRQELAETFPERQPIRRTARDTVRPNAVIAKDRDGNPIYRKRDNSSDPFAIPDDLKDPNWDMMWARVSVVGQEDISSQVNRQEQGWRFIPADRPGFDGRFMPPGYKGQIFKDGLALMERPMVLSEEAKREADQSVRAQSRAQRQQFGMALPEGFRADTPQARANTFARQGKPEATPDSLRPSHQTTGQDID